MSTLIAIAYPDAQTAEEVRGVLIQATKEQLVDLQDAVVVEHRSDGKIKLHQAVSTTGAGAAGGATTGSGTRRGAGAGSPASVRAMHAAPSATLWAIRGASVLNRPTSRAPAGGATWATRASWPSASASASAL